MRHHAHDTPVPSAVALSAYHAAEPGGVLKPHCQRVFACRPAQRFEWVEGEVCPPGPECDGLDEVRLILVEEANVVPDPSVVPWQIHKERHATNAGHYHRLHGVGGLANAGRAGDD